MMKSLAAFAIMSFLGLAVVALPGLAPSVNAAQPSGMAKADRLAVHGRDCTRQVWPDIDATCLRSSEAEVTIGAVRLVTGPALGSMPSNGNRNTHSKTRKASNAHVR